LEETYRLMQSEAKSVFLRSPTRVIAAYWSLVWENVCDKDYLSVDLMPHTSSLSRTLLDWCNRGRSFIWLALTGLFLLLITRRVKPALILTIGMLYFAVMTGSFKWQGSRIFHPGLIPGAILCATAIISGLRILTAIALRMRDRLKSLHLGANSQSR